MLIVKTVECENDSRSRHESSHNLLSQMLSLYTKYSYSQLEKDENGKPFINGTAFSISHSYCASCVALVIDEQEVDDAIIVDAKACSSCVGVDIESVADKSVERCKKIAQQKFFESEVELLKQCSCDDEYIKLFCLMWTQKESYSKFTGVGLKDALRFDTTQKNVDFKIYSEIIVVNNQSFAMSVCYNSDIE